MGGKSSQSTQQIQIPPEVLARYNAVNARAESTASTPFQQYSSDPNAFVAPLTETQQAGIANTNYYAGTAQPYYYAATGQLMGAQNAAYPYYGQATQQVGQAQDVGNIYADRATQALYSGQEAANSLQKGAYNAYQQGYYGAQPFNAAAAAQYYGGLAGAQPLQAAAVGNLGEAQNVGSRTTNAALGTINNAYGSAQPFQNLATQYMGAGAQAVNPGALGAEQINQYMSPYLSNVLQGTAALQNQMNQQAMAGQTGNAIRSGAFGGDRSGISAANLAQQQQLASSKTFSDILNQGYNQALGTAQQQQQLGLGAQQANRAALQQASQQALGIGQQGFGQGLAAAQQQGNLAQQLYGMGSGTAQQQAALAQQIFGQGATTGQGMAALGQQIYGQGTGYGQAQQGLGQQLFGQGTATSQQLANIGQQQFGQGMTAAQQNAALGAGLYGMGSQTAQGLANLGVGAQAAGLQGAQAQLAAGQAQQQTQNAGLQALYNQFLQNKSYPFQVSQFLANIAEGTGALSGSTTTTNQAMGGFSDERLKENIKPIGKTFDGQNIYSYNFKGEPQTEIGLIAQEVEKHHPEAVGLAGGYKTVRYDKATDDAADRGHFAAGGAASMGGGVMPEHAGLGFADGGYAGFDPGLMQQIVAAYQNMYAPMQGQKGGLGAASYVPEATGAVGQLMSPGALPATPDPMGSAKGMVELGTGLGGLGGNLGIWDYTDAERAATERKKKEKAAAGHAYGGLAGGRHGYGAGGSTDTDDSDHPIVVKGNSSVEPIVVEGRRQPEPAPAPKAVPVPSATPAAAPLAQVAKVDTFKTVNKPSFQKVGLDIPQIGNTVGLNSAAALSPLQDSTGSILGGLGSIGSAAAAFSDRRLKENIKPVGKTFDGQTVYSYNYKGDHQTRMGLIAQEVAKHHPEAVHKVGGYGAVDYKKATGLAAHRGHFAIGGDVEDDNSGAPGMNIPMQGNQVGLAGAAGLSNPQDSTGDILSGLGSIGQAAGKIFKKTADGGFIAPDFKELDQSPDFNLDPEDLVSGGDPLLESLLRSHYEGQPKPAGLAPAKDDFGEEMQRRKAADEEWHKSMRAPTGLNPETRKQPLTSDISMIAKMIRGHEGTGQNPSSSAYGPYQMIDNTFVDYYKKMYPSQAANMSREAIIALKHTPVGNQIAERIGPQIIQDNAKIIASRGFEPSARNIYLAHFFGPETALRVLSANPFAPISSVVGDAPIRSNPFLRGKNVNDTLNFAENAMQQQQRLLSAPERSYGGRIHKEDGGSLFRDFDAAFPSRGGSLDDMTLEAQRRRYEQEAGKSPTISTGEVSPDQGAAVLKRASQIKAISPADVSAMTRSLPAENKGNLLNWMSQNSIGVENDPSAINSNAPTNTQPPALPAAGLAAAKERKRPIDEEISNIPGYNTDYYRTPFFKGLGRGSAQSWIPLLTGLGTFATTPTRSMLSGLLAGVGAGAQSYGNIAAERNKELPTRQAAMAQMVDVGRQLLPSVLRLAPDGVNYIYMSQDGPVTISPQDATALRQKILYGTTGQLPAAPAGAKPYTYEAPTPKQFDYQGISTPNMTSVAGINAYAHQDPTVAAAFSARQQAAEEMAAARRLIDSAYADPADIERGTARLTAATKQYEAADQRYTSARNAIMQPLLTQLHTSVDNIGSYNIGVLAEREREVSSLRPLEPILKATEAANFAGGVSSNFWNNITSLAKQLGAPDQAVGDGQTDAQKRAALAKLLEGTGINADALSVSQDPNATKAVVEALRARIQNANDRYHEILKKVEQPTATPTAVPGADFTAPLPKEKRVVPSKTPSPNVQQIKDGVWASRSIDDAKKDPRVKNGDYVWLKDASGQKSRVQVSK